MLSNYQILPEYVFRSRADLKQVPFIFNTIIFSYHILNHHHIQHLSRREVLKELVSFESYWYHTLELVYLRVSQVEARLKYWGCANIPFSFYVNSYNIQCSTKKSIYLVLSHFSIQSNLCFFCCWLPVIVWLVVPLDIYHHWHLNIQ